MKTGKFEEDFPVLVEGKELEEMLICPSNQDVYNVKRVLYCPVRTLCNADIVRSKRIDSSDIERVFDLIQLAGFGNVIKTKSLSNRNKGVKEFIDAYY